MKFTLDGNLLFNDAIAAMQTPLGVGIVFALLALLMSPWLIPAISKAVAEHRKISHQREQQLMKIRNSRSDRAKTKQIKRS